MIFINARIEVDPAQIENFVEAARQIVEPTRQEKGCNVYSFARDICQNNVIWISEEWESEEDLEAHLKTDHINAFVAKIPGLSLLSMDAKKYQVASVAPMNAPEA